MSLVRPTGTGLIRPTGTGLLRPANVGLVRTASNPQVTTYLATILADNPVGYWKLDEPSGVNAADSSGNSLTGTYTAGPTLNVAPLIASGKAVTFDGASNYVLLPSNALLNPTAAISIECWCKTVSAATNRRMWSSQTGSAGGDKGLLRVNTSHKAEVTLFDSGDNAQTFAGAVTIDDNAPHHVVATYNGTVLLLYVDGNVDGVGLTVAMTLESVLHTAQIGCRLNNVSAFSEGFPGTIDEVAIYPTALSAARVAAHYAARTLT